MGTIDRDREGGVRGMKKDMKKETKYEKEAKKGNRKVREGKE